MLTPTTTATMVLVTTTVDAAIMAVGGPASGLATTAVTGHATEGTTLGTDATDPAMDETTLGTGATDPATDVTTLGTDVNETTPGTETTPGIGITLGTEVADMGVTTTAAVTGPAAADASTSRKFSRKSLAVTTGTAMYVRSRTSSMAYDYFNHVTCLCKISRY